MKAEIKWFIYCMTLGGSLIAYAHSQFATKDSIRMIHKDVREIRRYLMGPRKVVNNGSKSNQ